ncbi:MAG: hypothetical protein ACLSG5_14820 [Oscillospiraceae bacterium]
MRYCTAKWSGVVGNSFYVVIAATPIISLDVSLLLRYDFLDTQTRRYCARG